MDSFRILRYVVYGLYFICALAECCTDFVFIIDGSTELKSKFKEVIDTALEISSGLDVDKHQHRVALLEFGSELSERKWPKYRFGQINTQKKLENSINKLPSLQGSGNKAKAFGIVQQQLLSGHRSNVPLVILTISDGHFASNSEKETVKQLIGELVAQRNIYLFGATLDHSSLGISTFTNGNLGKVVAGRNVAKRTLKLLEPFINCTVQLIPTNAIKTTTQKSLWSAKTTKSPKTTTANIKPVTSGIKALQKPWITGRKNTALETSVTRTPSKITTKRPVTTRPGCQYDIVFLMDFSDGTEDKRSTYVQMASSLVKELQLGLDAVQVCMVRYSGPRREDTVFHLNKHTNATQAIEEMNAASHMGGTTRTGEAILYAVDEFKEKNGGRKDAIKMLIVFTDGYSQEDPAEAAQQARKSGINIRAVAVDDDDIPPNKNQLNEIAGNSKEVYISNEFEKLQSQVLNQLRRCT